MFKQRVLCGNGPLTHLRGLADPDFPRLAVISFLSSQLEGIRLRLTVSVSSSNCR
jgi:hypothetical protein